MIHQHFFVVQPQEAAGGADKRYDDERSGVVRVRIELDVCPRSWRTRKPVRVVADWATPIRESAEPRQGFVLGHNRIDPRRWPSIDLSESQP